MATLRELRTAKPISIRGLAQAAGIAPTTYLHLEAGRRLAQPGTMVKIAAALGVEVGDVTEFIAAMEVHRQGRKGPKS